MPIVSNVQLSPGLFVDDFIFFVLINIFICLGSVVASMVTNGGSSSASQALSSGVNTLTSNPTVVTGGSVRSVSINGRTYYASSSSDSYGQVDNSALIGGLVGGLVGAALLVVVGVVGYKQYQKRRRGRRLINDDTDFESSSDQHIQETREVPRNVSQPANNNVNRNQHLTIPSRPPSVLNPARFDTPLPTLPQEERVPSAAMSVTMLDVVTPNNPKAAKKQLPMIELIKFD